jgi:hypothetical protein
MKLIHLLGIYTLLLCVGLTLTGCMPTPEEIKSHNTNEKNSPQVVEQMPDGRTLYCMEILNPRDPFHRHFVYYFGTNDTRTVSENYQVPAAGKSTYTQTIVIEGKEFILTPKH